MKKGEGDHLASWLGDEVARCESVSQYRFYPMTLEDKSTPAWNYGGSLAFVFHRSIGHETIRHVGHPGFVPHVAHAARHSSAAAFATARAIGTGTARQHGMGLADPATAITIGTNATDDAHVDILAQACALQAA